MIRLTIEQLEVIKRHGEHAYPEEGCGVLLGHVEGEAKVVEEIRLTPNARRDSPRNRYAIAPEELLRLEREARARGREVLGFFHSHPDAEARPSAYDLEHAWPWYSYLIVSVRAAASESVHSWVLREDRSRFEQEEILIG
ncbi:MAG: M67 family metallopeptidase [Blastocatellia bacterium]|nr:M67 family metallopeptidase [Blastocatellia bacterium]MCS7158096.1 M67 family metallopeptidase [Blastocatellia bacterium]MCX7753041.1 M67 family metallopeptidase [Blastocatellia bacterium]MDW8168564.1 M67 family metallopeptidase [Acidobacteriota bacterium]MDW8257273.1 M67 family metallopeptidase [Acidobacteriota bacterium]